MVRGHRPFEGLAEKLAGVATAANTPLPTAQAVAKNVRLHPDTVARAEEHAKTHSKPIRKRSTKPKQPPVIQETSMTVDPEVLRTALVLAGFDHRRLEILPDGAVLVLNNPRTTKPQPNR
jgi:hypothetical protein